MVAVFFLRLFTKTTDASAFDLQKEIDAAKEGAELLIPKGRYEGSYTIRKSITLRGASGTELVAIGEEPIVCIEDVQDVVIENLSLTVQNKAIIASDVEGLTLLHLTIRDIHTGIFMQRAKDVWLQNLSITGKEGHYSKKGNSIAVFKSKDIVVEDSAIQQVQDGIYIEEVERIAVANNTVQNSRYGTHFMYTRDEDVQKNVFSQNVTG